MELPAPFGKYHLLERIAVGGMAEVYLAKSFGAAGFERLLVIKKILPHMAEDQEFITMFIDEARIASTLNHSNIVQINELGKEGNDYFIAMEFVQGRDLARTYDRLASQKRTMPIPLAVLITSRICEGLEYAHRKIDSSGRSLKIVHRDVSPGNVLISFDGDVKLIDFGIAKAQNRMGRTTAGTLKGKFGYMSPEQVRGHPLDHRSDLFSVGILLYEMLTGERLFGGESDFGTLEKVRNAVVVPPTTYNSKIPRELEQVVLRALAREPEERYEWASDLQEDLVRFLMHDGSLTTGKSLAAFLRELFQEDLLKETEKLAKYRQRGYPWVDAALADRPAQKPEPKVEVVLEKKPAPAPRSVEMDRAAGILRRVHIDKVQDQVRPEANAGPAPAKHPEPEAVFEKGPLTSEAAASGEEGAPPEQATVVVPGFAEGGTAKVARPSPVIIHPSKPKLARVEERPRRERRPTGELERTDRGRTGTEYVGRRRPLAAREERAATTERVGKPVKAAGSRKKEKLVIAVVTAVGLAIVAAAIWVLIKPPTQATPSDEAIPGEMVNMAPPAPTKPAPEEEAAKPEPEAPAKPEGKAQELNAAAGPDAASPATLPSPPDAGSSPGAIAALPAGGQPASEEVAAVPDGGGVPAAGDTAPAKPKEDKPATPVTSKVAARTALPIEPVRPRAEPSPRKNSPAPEPAKASPPPAKRAEEHGTAKGAGKPVALAQDGSIDVQSDPPGADILLNGQSMGTAPKFIGGLDASKSYFLVLRKSGYKKFFQGVKFDSGAVVKVSATLAPESGKSAAAAAPVPDKAPPKQPAKDAVGAPAAGNSASGTGFLVANSKPWAKVSIDGKDTGLWTPIPPTKQIAVPAGKHQITFTTQDGKSITVPVEIEAGKTLKLIKEIP